MSYLGLSKTGRRSLFCPHGLRPLDGRWVVRIKSWWVQHLQTPRQRHRRTGGQPLTPEGSRSAGSGSGRHIAIQPSQLYRPDQRLTLCPTAASPSTDPSGSTPLGLQSWAPRAIRCGPAPDHANGPEFLPVTTSRGPLSCRCSIAREGSSWAKRVASPVHPIVMSSASGND